METSESDTSQALSLENDNESAQNKKISNSKVDLIFKMEEVQVRCQQIEQWRLHRRHHSRYGRVKVETKMQAKVVVEGQTNYDKM